MTRPDARLICDALLQHDLVVAKRLLREWWIGLKRERLPGGECWVIGSNFFWFDFHWELVRVIREAVANSEHPRIFIGRDEFWRLACSELVKAGQSDQLRRRLPGVLRVYSAEVYVTWARLLVSDGQSLEAGKYFLFSGLYDDSESDFVARFKRTLSQAHPNEIVGRMPGPCAVRRARRAFPPRVYEDLANLPCPDWLMRRPT